MTGIAKEWRPVVGLLDRYEVSDCGDVRSIPRWVNSKAGSKQFRPSAPIKTKVGRGGYATCELCGEGGRKLTRFVHRLVAEAFLGESDGMQVNHKDGDKLNNRLSNLEWVTPSENVRHAIGIGLVDTAGRDKRCKEMREARKRPVVVDGVGEFESITEAAEAIGSTESMLCQVLRGRYRHTKGYTAHYKEVCDGE